VRPSAALGIGLPALVAFVWAQRERPRTEALWRLGLFCAPALGLAALFLLANALQHGAPFTTGYARELQYAAENGFRFTNVQPEELLRSPEFDFGAPLSAQLANVTTALFRLNFALYGWPCSLLFIGFAGFGPATRLAWSALAGFFALHFATHNAGIDTFAPVHFYEAGLPLLVLSVAGLARSTAWLREHVDTAELRASGIPSAVCAASIAVALAVYVPVRLGAIARVAENIRLPFEAIERSRLSDAVVFASRPFAPPCRSAPTNHFVFWRPNNDPDLRSDVLWANHIDVQRDRELMRHFPGRSGWVMLWTRACEVHLLPLDELEPGSIPRGYVGGRDEASGPGNGPGQG
jgi:hypothetical protein